METEQVGRRGPSVEAVSRIALLLAVGTYLCPSLHSPEFYGHLAVGHWISAHREVPSRFLWSLVGEETAWRSVSWLFQLVLSFIEQLAGEKGLIVAKMSAICFMVWSVVCCLSLRASDRFSGTFFGLAISCGVLPQAPFEPKILGIALAAQILYRAELLRRGAGLKELILLFCCAVLGANLHAFPAVAAFAALLFLKGGDCRFPRGLIALLLFVSQLLTPYGGLQLLSAAQGFLNERGLDIVQQADPATIFNYSFAFLVLLWLLFAVLWRLLPAETGMPRAELLCAALSSLVGLSSAALLPYALVFSGLLVAAVWEKSASVPENKLAEGFERLRTGLLTVSPTGVLWVLLCLLFVNVYNLLRLPTTKVLLPRKEVDYILEQKLPFPLLHESAVGSYLVYRFADAAGKPMHLAASTPLIRELNPELARAELAMESLGSGWEDYLSFVSPKTVLCRTSSALFELLRQDPQWQLVLGEPEPRNPLRWAVFQRTE